MTDSYYLINDRIKFYFDIENQYIEFKGKKESLEPKEAQILKYIIEHNVEGIISSENILDNNWDFWSDKKVLQKVLSTLRKKFKNTGVTENGFVAAGSDYKINYLGVLVNDQHLLKQRNVLRSKMLHSVKAAFLWALAGAITLLIIIKLNEKPRFTIDNIIQATAISGVSVEPALSPDGSALAFSHKKDKSAQIYLKIDSNLNFQALTNQHYDQVPAWSPSGRQLAFQRLEPGICEIRLIKLNEDYTKVGSDEKITDCNKHTYLSRISWKTEDILYFTDTNKRNGPFEIKQVNVNTHKVTTYFSHKNTKNEPYTGSGQYFIVYNKILDTLFSLESPDWVVSNINKINKDNTVTQIQRVGDVLLSIDIFDNHVIFKDLDNQLKSFSLDNTQELVTIYKNPLKPIGYPAVSANSNKIAIVSGSVFRNNIYSMDINSNDISEIISSQFRLKELQEVDNEILYVSGKTGIYQIYTYSNNIQTQLTNFTKNKRIVHFTISNNKKWLAINFIDSTVLYKRHINGLTSVKSFPLMSFPAFSKNNDRILLKNLVSESRNNQRQWKEELVEFDLMTFSETGISIKNASFGVYHQSGIIYVSSDKGINLFKLNEVKTLYDSVGPRKPSLFAVNDKYMFVSNNKHATRVDLKSKHQLILPAKVKGQITANNKYIYFKNQQLGSMVIFKGELVTN